MPLGPYIQDMERSVILNGRQFPSLLSTVPKAYYLYELALDNGCIPIRLLNFESTFNQSNGHYQKYNLIGWS
jgi:hypothetical protein